MCVRADECCTSCKVSVPGPYALDTLLCVVEGKGGHHSLSLKEPPPSLEVALTCLPYLAVTAASCAG